MTSALRRLAAVLLAIALFGGPARLCAGWMLSAEARMDCCEDGSCPMHKGEEHTFGAGISITQQDADACCASATTQGSTSTSPSAPMVTAAVLGPGIVVPPATPTLVLSSDWRILSPVPRASPPTHVLLSTFLI